MPTLRLAPGDDLEPFVAALEAGGAALIPTDTVYGLACAAALPDACERMVGLKGRDLSKPTSIIAASLDRVLATVLPELTGRAESQARRLLPGPVTLVVPNPAGRLAWLCGDDPTRIGLRVPVLDPALAAVIDRVGAVAATSANMAGGPDPASLGEVPELLRARVAVSFDTGPTPGGVPSTVIDLTGAEPVILRQGALSEATVRALLVD
jgi:L-threonylcarbamoyladenylate synthase